MSRSLTGRVWRSRLDLAGENRALALVQRLGLPEPLARVVAGRGVGPEEAAAFLDPAVRDLMPDPSTLRGLDEAVERLCAAIRGAERVAIFGDYDVDGACSAALLAGYLDACGTPCRIHIPDRELEGYGPNPEAIRAFAAEGATLLVCVDCGTTSHETLALARDFGLSRMVLDHHLAAPDLPDAIVVNPNRQDCLSGLGHLCAAGVVLMTLVGVNRRLRAEGFWTDARRQPDLMGALDLVALATVADVAPLVGLNRAFVARGLDVFARRARAGLVALADVARLDGPAQAWHLGFLLGPRINAGGRIGDAALGARLLLERDPVEAARIAATLDRLNGERRALEAGTVEDALALVLAQGGGEAPVVVAAREGWRPGVVGLVAARLREKFGRPAFAIALSDGVGTGSGRSLPGVDLGAAVRAAVEAGLLVKGGGHRMAAGVTVLAEAIPAFEAFMASRLGAAVEAARADDALRIDGALTAGGATLDFVSAVSRAGPFGAGAQEPVFALRAHRVAAATPIGAGHLRVALEAGDGARLEAMAFRAAETPLGSAILARRGGALHAAASLEVDRYGGRERVSARLLDAADPA